MADDVHEHVEMYVEAAARAATRSRDVIVLIIVVSVLIFGAFWNSRQGSWMNSRMRSTAQAVKLLKLQKAYDDAIRSKSAGAQALKVAIDARAFDQAREFLNVRPHYDLAFAEQMLGNLQRMQAEHVFSLRIPFFGLVVDVNDLGILGGFAFSVLLLWLRFSLRNELQNMTITFVEGTRHKNSLFCYEALAMQQVLAVPPSLRGIKESAHWAKAAKALMLLPVGVQLIVFAYDCKTFAHGWSSNPLLTAVGITLTATFLFCVAGLTYMCFSIWSEIDGMWIDAADHIRKRIHEEAGHEELPSTAAIIPVEATVVRPTLPIR